MRVIDHFREREAAPRTMVPIQIVNNLGMPETPMTAGRAHDVVEVQGMKIGLGEKKRERKVVLAREEDWRTKTEKAVDGLTLDENPSAIGVSPEPKTVVVAPRVTRTPKLEIRPSVGVGRRVRRY